MREFKNIKKLFRILAWALLILVVLCGVGYIAFQSAYVQTKVTQRVASYLSKELDAVVSVDGVDVELIKTLVLEGVYVEDQRGDTLLALAEIKGDITSYNLKEARFNIASLYLGDGAVYLSKTENGLNLDFLIDYFSSGEPSNASPVLECGSLELENLHFRWTDELQPRTESGMDYAHLDVDNISLRATNVSVRGDTIACYLNHLAAQEQCGFVLQQLSGEVLVHSQLSAIDGMTLETDRSQLQGSYAMHYEEFPAYLEYIEEVTMQANLTSGSVSSIDLAYFAPALEGLDEVVRVSGIANGTVDNLKTTNLKLGFQDHTHFEGEVDLAGLPNIEETFIRIKADQLTTHQRDLDRIPLPPFAENKRLETPPALAQLGELDFSGTFTGYTDDFLAFGNLESDLGALEADLELVIDSTSGQYRYSGSLLSDAFAFGELLPKTAKVGQVGVDLNIVGEGVTLATLDAELDGVVKFIDLNRYRYQNIDVSGTLVNKQFLGELTSRDPNALLEFTGGVNFSGELPDYDFTVLLENANLHKLNLWHPDSTATFATEITLKLTGTTIDNLRGTATATNTRFTEQARSLDLADFYLATGEDDQGNRHLELNSDYLRAAVSGKYQFEELPIVARYLISHAAPSMLGGKEAIPSAEQNFDFRVEVTDSKPFTDFFVPGFSAPEGVLALGNYEGTTNTLDLNITSPVLDAQGRRIHGLDIQVTGRDSLFDVQGETHLVQLADTIGMKNVEILVKALNDNVQFSFGWDNQNNSSAGDFTGLVEFLAGGRTNVSFLSSDFMVAGHPWTISPGNDIRIDSSSLDIRNFRIGGTDQYLALNGKLSERSRDELELELNDFNLNNIAFLTASAGTNVAGIVSGKATLADPYNALLFRCDLDLAGLEVNGVELGDGTVISSWNPAARTVALNGNLSHSSGRTLEIGGFYRPDAATDNLDMLVKTENLSLNVVDPYVEDFLDNLTGSLSGQVKIEGTPAQPRLNGSLKLEAADFLFTYLNTQYSIRDETVIIQEDFIGFDLIQVNDAQGNHAIATGTVFHNNYSDFNFDVSVESDKFQYLNTKPGDNYLYYGTAYMSGLVNMSGYADNLALEISAKTEKGTELFIPLDEDEDAEEIAYITFVRHDTLPQDEYEVDLDGIYLDFDLEVTPEAEVQIIFDQKLGDIMRGRGSGNVKMEISTLGDFNIYGDYVVSEGDYLFTLQNVINKKFTVEPGGSITFNGDPYTANIDLAAIYKLKTSLINIAELGIDSSSARRVPVEVYLRMSDELLEPEIDFDIKLPSVDENTRSLFANAIQSDEEKNRQVFSLLILNSFMATGGAGGGNNFAGTGSAELLSNQLSNWLSQISREVDIGFNYRPGDEVTEDEVELALSTQLFNDKVIVETNLGVGGNNTYASEQTNALVGDFKVEYKIDDEGKLRAKVFNESNDYDLLDANNAQYTQGVGVFYTEEFDTFGELMRKIFRRRRIKQRDIPVGN